MVRGFDAALDLNARTGLPSALRELVELYPRATWESHPNFGDLVRFWMQRHALFRQLLDVLQTDARARIGGNLDFENYTMRLSHYAGTLVNELHGHHQIEDHHYFPKLQGLDARVTRGFDLLEKDHEALDGVLHDLANSANAVLQGGETGVFLDRLAQFGAVLDRHLTDEEEIIVPVILHTGFRG